MLRGGECDRREQKEHRSSKVRGGTPLCKLYRYVLPQRVWVLRLFSLKAGIDFAHFGLESGMDFRGTTAQTIMLQNYCIVMELVGFCNALFIVK